VSLAPVRKFLPTTIIFLECNRDRAPGMLATLRPGQYSTPIYILLEDRKFSSSQEITVLVNEE